MHLLEVAQHECCSKAAGNQENVAEVEALAEIQTLDVCCSVEGSNPQTANCDCLTAEASRRLTSFDEAILDVLGCDSNASELGTSNVSSVVAARCRCCPTDEASVSSGDEGQRVLGVEFFDVLPTDLNSGYGVHDGDTLVANYQRGSHQTKPGKRNHESGPGPARKVLPIAYQNTQRDQSDDCCQNDAAPRSKNLHVSHVSIIAGDVK